MKEKGAFLFVTPHREKVKTAKQTGIFERLLCHGCEQHLANNFEGKVHDWFDRTILDPAKVKFGEEVVAQVDYREFRLYMLSILWRASIASEPPFHRFALDLEHEERIRRAILALDPLSSAEIRLLVMSVEIGGGWTRGLIRAPEMGEVNGVPTASFIVAGLVVSFFLGSGPVHEDVARSILNEDGKLRMKRMHIQDLPGLAEHLQLIGARLKAFESKFGRRK